MRKDIYIVSIKNHNSPSIAISSEGYENIYDAMAFVESRADCPVKDRFVLKWTSPENTYQIHVIKVGD